MDNRLTNLRAAAADVRYLMDKQSADIIAWAADEIERMRAENETLRRITRALGNGLAALSSKPHREE